MRNHLRTVLESFEEMQSINLPKMTNLIHREFLKDTLKVARENEAVVQQLNVYLQWLEDAYQEEMQASLIVETVQQLTAEIDALATQRSFQQTAVKSGYRALMGSTDADKVVVGTLLFNLAHKYDLHTGMNVNEQTAAIDSFILDIEQNHLADLEATGQMDLFNQLKRVNEAVCDKVIERNKAKVGLGINRLRNARLESDKAWRALRYAVNSKSFLEGYQPFAAFIGYMNVLIISYKRQYLGETVESPEATPGAGDDNEETLPSSPDSPSSPSSPSTPSTPSSPSTPTDPNNPDPDDDPDALKPGDGGDDPDL